MFVADDVDVWAPGVVAAVKHDIITVSMEPAHQVSAFLK